MKGNSIMQKGKRFEKFIANEVESEGFGLARREVGSGSGKKKGDIACNLPFLIECKNHKKLNWHQSIDQAKEQARIGNYDRNKWALVVQDSRSPETNPEVFAVIDFWQFLKLLKKDKEPMVKEPDRELAFDIKRLVEVGKKIIKRLEK